MLINSRECALKEHQQQTITHLCTYKNCNQPYRWVCYICKDQNIHDHQELGQENQLIDLRNSKKYLSEQIQPILDYNEQQQENINGFKKNLKSLQEQIQTLEKQFQQQERKITESLSFRNKLNQGIIYLTPEEINKLLNLDDFIERGPQEEQNEIFSTVINQTQGFIKSSQDYFQNQVKEHDKMKQSVISILQSGKAQMEDDKMEYEFESKYERQNIYCSQISPNAIYLAISNAGQIEVIDLEKTEKQEKDKVQDQEKSKDKGKDVKKGEGQIIKMKNIITTLQFSLDSELLFAGDYKGILYCFEIKQKIRKIYEKRIHDGNIQKIVVINNNQVITCSQDKSIQIVTIDQKIENPIANAHQESIQGLEFDQRNNVIISSSSDNLIRFFSCQCEYKCQEVCSRYLYLMKQEYQNVKQIQLLYKNKLLATDGKQINLWEIQYDNQQLVNLQSFVMPFGSIYSIENKFFYIDKHSVYVYDNKLSNKTFEIKHGIGNDHGLIQPRMYNQVKYLIVQSSKQIKLFQRKQQQN